MLSFGSPKQRDSLEQVVFFTNRDRGEVDGFPGRNRGEGGGFYRP